jgi:hypothetical protein
VAREKRGEKDRREKERCFPGWEFYNQTFLNFYTFSDTFVLSRRVFVKMSNLLSVPRRIKPCGSVRFRCAYSLGLSVESKQLAGGKRCGSRLRILGLRRTARLRAGVELELAELQPGWGQCLGSFCFSIHRERAKLTP